MLAGTAVSHGGTRFLQLGALIWDSLWQQAPLPLHTLWLPYPHLPQFIFFSSFPESSLCPEHPPPSAYSTVLDSVPAPYLTRLSFIYDTFSFSRRDLCILNQLLPHCSGLVGSYISFCLLGPSHCPLS